MSVTARALVMRAVGAAPTVEDVQLAEPVDDEVLVRIRATGICHTDVAAAAGRLPVLFPTVLGHEAAGVVEQVGPAVSRVQPGDRVVVAITHHCGRCRLCSLGYPPLCPERSQARPRITGAAGPLVQGFGTGTFATATVLRERSVVRIPDEVPFEVAAVTGCAVATGCGGVFKDAQVRPGSTVLVIGCGGVGLSTVMAARVAGARKIVVVDPRAARRDVATQVGADLALEPSREALQDMQPEGFDYCFESAGTVEAMELALACGSLAGTTTLMGLAAPDLRLPVPVLSFVIGNQKLLGCNLGRLQPDLDFPTYFQLYAAGRLPLDVLVGRTVPLTEAPTALALAAEGDALRVVMTA